MFRGYEKSDVTTEHFVGNNICNASHLKASFGAYKIKKYGLWDRVGEMDTTELGLIADAIRNNRSISSLSDAEVEIWKGINGRFAHEENNIIVSDILVIPDDGKGFDNVDTIFKSHKSYGELIEKMSELFDRLEDILRKSNLSGIHDSTAKIISTELWKVRGITIIDEVESGRLTVPENPEKSTIAMYISI